MCGFGMAIFSSESGEGRIIKTNRHEGNYFNLVTIFQKISRIMFLRGLFFTILTSTELRIGLKSETKRRCIACTTQGREIPNVGVELQCRRHGQSLSPCLASFTGYYAPAANSLWFRQDHYSISFKRYGCAYRFLRQQVGVG
jgi:hypothetical protein